MKCPRCHEDDGLFAHTDVPFTLDEEGKWEEIDNDGPTDDDYVECINCDWSGTVKDLEDHDRRA